jgi:hypothetical protein
MEFLEFADFSFRPDVNIGYLSEELNNISGESICYDTFKVQNTKWVWLVNDGFAAVNSNKLLIIHTIITVLNITILICI